MATEYDAQFFDVIRAGVRSSASVVVPLLIEALAPALDERTAIDVGCGEGWWGSELAAVGFAVRGIDANPPHTVIDVVDHDLEQPLPDMGRFGMAVCLEVAEHLSSRRADSFIDDLCALSDIIVFSAAIPGQGGAGHLNEQWPAYWEVKLFQRNYHCSGALRWKVWGDKRVENWYSQNLMVAARCPERLPNLFDTPLAPMWPVVHPVLFDARRS